MRKFLKVTFVTVAALLCACACAACEFGTGNDTDDPVKLAAPTLTIDASAKTASWTTVCRL